MARSTKKKKRTTRKVTGPLAEIFQKEEIKPPKRKRYSIYVLVDTWERFDDLCREQGIGLSRAVERFMQRALDKVEEK